jgi:hypothetical protein
VSFTEDRTDHCSCDKPADAWGRYGFHFAEWNQEFIERRILNAPDLRPDWSEGAVTDDELRGRLANEKNPERARYLKVLLNARNEHRRFLSNYLGSSYVFEECPRYIEAKRLGAMKKKERDANENVRQSTGVRLR